MRIKPTPRWRTPKWLRRILIAAIGFSILLFGIIVFILPTPLGWVVIPVGLVLLATEFVWARRLLKKIRAQHKVLDTTFGSAEKHAQAFTHTLFGPDDDSTPGTPPGLRKSA